MNVNLTKDVDNLIKNIALEDEVLSILKNNLDNITVLFVRLVVSGKHEVIMKLMHICIEHNLIANVGLSLVLTKAQLCKEIKIFNDLSKIIVEKDLHIDLNVINSLFLLSCREDSLEHVNVLTTYFLKVLSIFQGIEIAANHNSESVLNSLLLGNNSIKDIVFSGKFLLVRACENNNLNLVKLLTVNESLSKIFPISYNNYECVIESCTNLDKNCIEYLLSLPGNSIPENILYDGLLRAVECDAEEIVMFFLKHVPRNYSLIKIRKDIKEKLDAIMKNSESTVKILPSIENLILQFENFKILKNNLDMMVLSDKKKVKL